MSFAKVISMVKFCHLASETLCMTEISQCAYAKVICVKKFLHLVFEISYLVEIQAYALGNVICVWKIPCRGPCVFETSYVAENQQSARANVVCVEKFPIWSSKLHTQLIFSHVLSVICVHTGWSKFMCSFMTLWP